MSAETSGDESFWRWTMIVAAAFMVFVVIAVALNGHSKNPTTSSPAAAQSGSIYTTSPTTSLPAPSIYSHEAIDAVDHNPSEDQSHAASKQPLCEATGEVADEALGNEFHHEATGEDTGDNRATDRDHDPSNSATTNYASGHYPSGHYPSGHYPPGHHPSGHDPTGHDPTGHDPTGHDPSGHDPDPTADLLTVGGDGPVGQRSNWLPNDLPVV